MLTIPLSRAPKQTMTTTLGGRSFRLRVRWNTVMEAWYLDVQRPDGSHLLSGQRLVVSWPIRVGSPDTGGLEAGSFLMALDQSGQNLEAGRDAWGVTHHLVWMTRTDALASLSEG